LSVTDALTFTAPPTSWGEGTAVADEITGGVPSAVVKVARNMPAMGFPGSLASRAVAFTWIRYTIPWAKGPEGVKTRSFAVHEKEPEAYALVSSRIRENAASALARFIASENVTLTGAAGFTPVVPFAGMLAVTEGVVESMIKFPMLASMAVAPFASATVTRTLAWTVSTAGRVHPYVHGFE
jgi:hypothetical protein